MPLTLWMAAAILADDGLRSYKDPQLGISFQYPRSWNLRKEKYMTVLTWRTKGGREARAQWVPTVYRDTAALWQQLQVDVAANRNDKIVRQWEEEILGVPLLMTRVERIEKGRTYSVWGGLIYSRTPTKLNFRVYSSPEDAAETEEDWRKVLLSVRTEAGDTPLAEMPGSKIEPVKPKDPDLPVVTWTTNSDQAKLKPVRAPKRLKIDGFFAYSPEAWTVEGSALACENLKGVLTIEARRVKAGTGLRAFLGYSGSQLNVIDQVESRNERQLGLNKAGYTVWEVVRTGTSKGKSTTMGLWAGQLDDNMWFVSYQGDATTFRADRGLIESLVTALSVESAG